MIGWAKAFLAEPWPALTLFFLATAAVAVFRPLSRKLGWPALPTLGALLGLAAIATLTLPPAPGTTESSGLAACGRALADLEAFARGLVATNDRGERVGNVLMFMPFTFFATLASRRPGLVALVGVLLPVAIEVAQSALDLGRDCAARDWANNAIGAVLGIAFAVVMLRLIKVGRVGQ
ncbi:VanZ family protein [Micromonospora sp. CPCC 206061]|uniref:VanZ family protein n=1 Tax=Micromonospora sp. CPCC 206061 TaxID=3122410 RepID=UPI002FF2024B